MNYLDLTTHYYLNQIPTKKSFGGFGSTVFENKNFALYVKLAGMESIGFSLTNIELATEAIENTVEEGLVDKKEYIAGLRTAENGGFKKHPSRKLEPLNFARPVIAPISLFGNFENKFVDGEMVGLHQANRSSKPGDEGVTTIMGEAIFWGMMVGLEFPHEATDMAQLWISQSAIPELYSDRYEFFLDASKSLAELTSVCSKPYYLWKPS